MFLHRNRHEVDMVEGPLLPNIVRYAIPLMLTGILQLLYNMADVVVVGRFDSPEAIAAVGATSSLINLIVNLFMGLSVGTSVLVAQYYGAGSHRDIRETVHTSVLLSVLMGFLIGALGLVVARSLLVMMDTPGGVVLDGATLYMRIYFLGMPGNMLYNFGAAVLRAVGDTKRPLYYLTVAGLVNVCLNLVFVIVFHMGVAGVAIATIVSQYISAALIVLSLMRATDSTQLYLKELRLHRDKALRIVRVGLPAGLQGTIFSISNVLIQSSVNSFGAMAIAGNTAATNLEGFVYISMNSVYQAALSFTGQNIGARRYERIGKILRTCVLTVLALGAVLGLGVLTFAEPLLRLFVNAEYAGGVVADILYFGQLRMRIICSTYFLCGLMDVLVGMLRGMGSSMVPMAVSTVGVCVMRIAWVLTLFAMDRRLEVLYASYPASWLFTAAAHMLSYAIVYRRLLRRAAARDLRAGT